MRRLMMIAYEFPPSLSVGRMRTIKFCKYLPQFGWQPVVVTAPLPEVYDPAALAEIPADTEFHRVGHSLRLERWASYGVRAKAILGRLRPRLPSRSAPPAPGARSATTAAGGLNMLLFWPDPQGTWIAPAFRKALALARRCHAIYSTGWPMSDHLVAWRVARLTGLPWFMDHRDPWTVGSLAVTYATTVQQYLFRRLERRCVETCSMLCNVTQELTDEHRRTFPDQPPEKFVTLHNGFDPADFEGLPSPPPQSPLTLTYLGTLYAGRSPLTILRAIGGLVRAGRLAPGELLAQFIGSEGGEFADEAKRLGVDEFVRFQPRIPYRAALDALGRSHVAIMLGGAETDKVSMPSKVYEYLFLGKPILAVVPPGPLHDTLASAGAQCAFNGDDQAVGRILTGLLDVFRRKRSIPLLAGLPETADYSRRETARRLAGLITAALI